MSPGFVGLAFLPGKLLHLALSLLVVPGNSSLTVSGCTVMGGSIAALVIFMAWSSYHDKALKAGAPWALQEEYRRLPLACFGGPMYV